MSSSLEQSVKDRLKNIARETGKDFNFVSIQYLQERFLARLEKSPCRENLILKGALLLLAYDIPAVRPSKDIDFKGDETSNEIDEIASVIRDIAKIDLEDGVQFYPDNLDVQQITEDAEYDGLRIKITATIWGSKNWIAFACS
jgi:predicted nucleotidyltransferase component of viral defense system